MSRLSDGRRSIRGLSAFLSGLAESVRNDMSMASTPCIPPPLPTSRTESPKRLRRCTSRFDRGSASGRSDAVARGSRRGLLLALLCLTVVLGVALEEVQAQAATVKVPIDWALKPADVEAGESFRLLFVTSTGRNAQSTDIADYNAFVQTRAKAGHSAITDDIGDQFKVVGSMAAVDARDNTGTTRAGVPIYWLNGAKVADDYADF